MIDSNLENRLKTLGVSGKDLHPIFQQNPSLQLQLNDDKLTVIDTVNGYRLLVDFDAKKLRFRSQAHLNAELVNKAVFGKKKQFSSVLDCTAGFGKDAHLMSLTGAHIVACESNLLMYSLLKDGLHRQPNDNITLHHSNALDIIQDTDCPVIYMDPMYPASKKSAKNNKEMTFLQQCVGHQSDMANALLEQCLRSSAQKVVIKRPVKAALVLDKKPTAQITGKSVRFDIYQLK